MKPSLLLSAAAMATCLAGAAPAYDPAPDPRMQGDRPDAESGPYRSARSAADDGDFGAEAGASDRRRGEPRFGNRDRRKGGYETHRLAP